MRGYTPGRFSFNVKGGRCEACQGEGLVKIEMHFLPGRLRPLRGLPGRRYNRETLEVFYKGHSIADVLDLTVDEALELFDAVPRLRRHLQTLSDVGLGYIHLGQAATTLSGGEAQRVKLATELSGRRPAAPSTSSTSRPPGCTSRTCACCSRCCTGWSTRATRCW
jgi:excinuclease ABC subunit A